MKSKKKKQIDFAELKRCEDMLWPKVSPMVTELGFSLAELTFTNEHQTNYLRLTIKHPEHSVSLNDCELISRKVDEVLDEQDLIPFAYILEVQSSGSESHNTYSEPKYEFTIENAGLVVKA